MSGAGLPYHQRPHKAVDRRLFIDLLDRFDRWSLINDHAYVSMGAYALDDHKLIYKRFGLKRLLSFDYDKDIVQRQIFNRPTYNCRCVYMTSGAVVEDIESVLEKNDLGDYKNVMLWLDYTSARELNAQIREVQTFLGRAVHGDLLRVTLNAHADNLSRSSSGRHRETTIDILANRLREATHRLGDLLPSNVKAEDFDDERYPELLCRIIGRAAGQSIPATKPFVFVPLSLVSYADGQKMVSITGVVVDKDKQALMRTEMDLAAWPFSSESWISGPFHKLVVADLTLRERQYLEREVEISSATQIGAKLKFDFDKVTELDGFLESFRRYHRFYPTFLASEL